MSVLARRLTLMTSQSSDVGSARAATGVADLERPADTVPRWRAMAAVTGLVAEDGTVRPTIFAEMSALALAHEAVNLGQGFPDTDGPAWIRERAIEAINAGANQYPPGPGIPALRQAIARHQQRHYGITLDPDAEILVTTGATEAIAAAVVALASPGDEVLTLEPFYDSYAATIAMAGARHTTAALRPTPQGWRLDADALAAAITERTRVILLNSPHNPTGAVLTPEELAIVAEHARRSGAVVVTDEVYEHLTFDGARHVPLATLPGMRERTLTISSIGKSFSLTGWKIGWVSGPAELVTAVRTVKQFLTYVSGAPFQPAAAAALDDGDDDVAALADSLAARRDTLMAGLVEAGFEVARPDGTYFVCADASRLLAATGLPDGAALARALPELAGVACVPLSAFCTPGGPVQQALAPWLRFTFVKDSATIAEGVRRLHELATELGIAAPEGR